MDIQMAADGKREVLHDDRFEPADGRCRPYRLPRTDPLDGRRFQFRGTRRLHASYPVRSCPSWKYGGPEIHAGCFDSEILSGLISSMRAVEGLAIQSGWPGAHGEAPELAWERVAAIRISGSRRHRRPPWPRRSRPLARCHATSIR